MWHNKSCSYRLRAFTLIEVLVVVAIIALLLSILLPSLSRAREQAKIVVCKTRMQQIHRGHVFYAEDNKGSFPHWAWWLYDGYQHDDGKENFFTTASIWQKTNGVRATDSRKWVEYGDIYRFVKDKEVYFCPSDSKERRSPAIGSGGSNGDHAIHSYVRIIDPHQCIQTKLDGAAVNGRGSSAKLQPGDFINPDKLRPGAFWSSLLPSVNTFHSIPSRVGFLYEEDQGLGEVPGNTTNDALNDGHSSVVLYNQDFMSPRHLRRGHLAYFDGHVELLEAKRWNNYPRDNYVLYRALGGGSNPPVMAKP
jgi:prepilin-type N-terminal cleavage/methylation domain-containing protein/prepilin-type processing-associated H-X9-DG protein